MIRRAASNTSSTTGVFRRRVPGGRHLHHDFGQRAHAPGGQRRAPAQQHPQVEEPQRPRTRPGRAAGGCRPEMAGRTTRSQRADPSHRARALPARRERPVSGTSLDAVPAGGRRAKSTKRANRTRSPSVSSRELSVSSACNRHRSRSRQEYRSTSGDDSRAVVEQTQVQAAPDRPPQRGVRGEQHLKARDPAQNRPVSGRCPRKGRSPRRLRRPRLTHRPPGSLPERRSARRDPHQRQ